MYYYKIYGLYIESDYEFEEAVRIEKISEEKIDIKIFMEDIPEKYSKEREIDERFVGGIVYHYEADFGWIRSKNQGAWYVENGNKVTYMLKENYDKRIVNQVFLCAAIPALLVQKGVLALHGSGIAFDEKAIIVTGVSGAGKSTLTAKMLEKDGIFMADDTVALSRKDGKIYAEAAYPQQKICTDAITEKIKENAQLIALPLSDGQEKYARRLKKGYTMEKKELCGIFVLYAENVEEVQIQEISGSEKIKYLLNNLYKYKTYVQNGMPSEIFRKCIEVANQVPIYKVVRPKEGMTTDIQYKKIKQILEFDN